jgi:hypothetical protein
MGKYFLKKLALLWIFILITGCNVTNEQGYSDDLHQLRTKVELDINPRDIRWEIFGTPEHSGGVPGPTDFITLIAEVPTLEQAIFETRASSGVVWVAPEAARPWLSDDFKQILRKYRNKSVDLSSMRNCRVARGKLKKTGHSAEGFICNGPTKAMIYLTLAEPSES